MDQANNILEAHQTGFEYDTQVGVVEDSEPWKGLPDDWVGVDSMLGSSVIGQTISYRLPGDRIVKLKRPDHETIFKPDPWSGELIRGLSIADRVGLLTQNGVYSEIGVGLAINTLYLLLNEQISPSQMIISDIDMRMIPLALHNIAKNVPASELNKIKHYLSDLLRQVSLEPGSVDHMVACIPQVPLTITQMDAEYDHGNYFNPHTYRSKRDEEMEIAANDEEKLGPWSQYLSSHGLLLLNALLEENRKFLNPDNKRSSIIINVAGRPSLNVIQNMITQAGFYPYQLSRSIIEQHKGTNIQPFSNVEATTGAQFNFAADPQMLEHINATKALERMKQGQSVYHEMYTFACMLYPPSEVLHAA